MEETSGKAVQRETPFQPPKPTDKDGKKKPLSKKEKRKMKQITKDLRLQREENLCLMTKIEESKVFCETTAAQVIDMKADLIWKDPDMEEMCQEYDQKILECKKEIDALVYEQKKTITVQKALGFMRLRVLQRKQCAEIEELQKNIITSRGELIEHQKATEIQMDVCIMKTGIEEAEKIMNKEVQKMEKEFTQVFKDLEINFLAMNREPSEQLETLQNEVRKLGIKKKLRTKELELRKKSKQLKLAVKQAQHEQLDLKMRLSGYSENQEELTNEKAKLIKTEDDFNDIRLQNAILEQLLDTIHIQKNDLKLKLERSFPKGYNGVNGLLVNFWYPNESVVVTAEASDGSSIFTF
ncbi:DRC4 protein, partial [Polypterus senegalus]